MPDRIHRVFSRPGAVVAALALTLSAVPAAADPFSFQTRITDGFTPKGVEPGSPVGSYALSGFETVSLFSGKLSFALPLLQVGGRGAAGYTMTLPIESNWLVTALIDCTESSDFPTSCQNNGVLLTDGGWNQIPWLSPGILVARRGEELLDCTDIGGNPVVRTEYAVTRFSFISPDGSEVELVDDDPDQIPNAADRLGRPKQNPDACPAGLVDYARGRKFISMDGSALTFVADNVIVDKFDTSGNGMEATGNLMFPDGRTYRFVERRVEWIRDRNGNKVDFEYEVDTSQQINLQKVIRVTDSLGRQINIQHDLTSITGCEQGTVKRITYDGAGGNTRQIDICRDNISHDGVTTEAWDQLFVLPQANPALFDPGRPVWVELPDGRRYEFDYNSYGELIRAKLPTGGAFEYDWVKGAVDGIPGTGDDRGGIHGGNVGGESAMVYRRVHKRRVCSDGQSGSSCEQHIEYRKTSPSGETHVEVRRSATDGGSPSARDNHYFYGLPIGALGANPVASARWRDGREYKTEFLSGTGSTVFRTTDNIFEQMDGLERPWCAAVPNAQCNPGSPGTTAANRPRLAETTTIFHDASPDVSTRQVFEYDEFNNQTDVIEHDFSGAAQRHTQTSYKQDASYITPASNHQNYAHTRLLRLPTKRLVCGTGGVCTDSNSSARTEIGYDTGGMDSVSSSGLTGHCSNVAVPSGADPDYRCLNLNPSGGIETNLSFNASYTTRGNAVSVKAWRNPSSAGDFVETTRRYDMLGNLTQETDLNGKLTTVSYLDDFTQACSITGSRLAFPTTITKPLSLVTKVKYDCRLGSPTEVTDPNDVKMTFAYETGANKLDRPVEMVQGSNQSDPNRFKTVFEYGDTVNNLFVKTKVTRTSFTTLNDVAETRFDGLGRTEEVREFVPGGSNRTCTTYDELGRVKTTSNPALNTCSSDLTTSVYDALGRVTQVIQPGNATVNTTYLGNVTNVIDEAARKRQSTTDALGRLTEVVEDPDGLGYVTSYQYDLLDNLTQVSQSGQTRTFAYDGLSRLVCASNPESRTTSAACTVAAQAGMDRFTYDPNGNLLTKKDARNITTTNFYDDLNRITETRFSDATPWMDFTYGTAAPNLGRLTRVHRGGYATDFGYDALGRAVSSTQTVPGHSPYGFTYVYNLDSTLESQTYPSGRKVTWGYDVAGRPEKAGIDTVNATDYLQDATYAPHGAPSLMMLGNGLNETTSFNNRLQPTSIQAGTLLTLGFGYGTTNNNGNVTSQTISVPGQAFFTQSYGYDPLNRLESVSENSGSASWTRNFPYDAFGNRAVTGSGTGANVGLGSPQSLGDFDSSTNQLTAAWAGYDAAGNLTAFNRAALEWRADYDANNKQRFFCTGALASCTAANATGEYVYDGQGNRVEKIEGSKTTTYVYDAAGRLAAEYSSDPPTTTGGRFYRTTDHLGSTRLVTNATQAVVSRRDFYPFGEEIPAQSSTGRDGIAGYNVGSAFRQQFTGQLRDAESALDYFGARYYSPTVGRFTSVDPGSAGASVDDPRTWNTYVYAANSPLRFIDPTGLAIELPSDEEERNRVLAALQESVGDEAGQYLYPNEHEGTFYVGIYSGGPEGTGPDFGSINDASAFVSDQITRPEVASVSFAAEGSTVSFLDMTTTIGSASDDRNPGFTGLAGPAFFKAAGPGAGTNRVKILLTSGEAGSLPGVMMENGRPGSLTTGTVLIHELGHATALFEAKGKGVSDNRAVDSENRSRTVRGLPRRLLHDPPPLR